VSAHLNRQHAFSRFWMYRRLLGPSTNFHPQSRRWALRFGVGEELPIIQPEPCWMGLIMRSQWAHDWAKACIFAMSSLPAFAELTGKKN
jgi:hypothetical protein